MTSDIKIDRLEQLRKGNRFQYRGVTWVVRDCSSYRNAGGDRTTEWLIESTSGKSYYLLQEVHTENEEQLVEWYLAEPLKNPILSLPNSTIVPLSDIRSAMQDDREPYPQLQANQKVFTFDSKTIGIYQDGDSKKSRITWDYWDSAHRWNLALEVWEKEKRIQVYLTQKVQPEKFSHFETQFLNNAWERWQFRLALVLFCCGFVLLIFG
jgi:Domain of unknown function (DUF4178)